VTVAKLGCSATRIRLKALLLQQGRDPLGVRRADPLKDSERAAERRDPFSRPAVQKLAPADTFEGTRFFDRGGDTDSDRQSFFVM